MIHDRHKEAAKPEAADPQTICVVGAGVVGMATALALYEAGHSIILIEKEEAPAKKASALNGCQLSYSFVDALASPSTLRTMPKLALGLDPAFRIDFGSVLSNPAWLFSFLANSTSTRFRTNTLTALNLAANSRQVLHRWETDYNLEFARSRAGKLVLIGSEEVKSKLYKSVELKRFGSLHQKILNRREVLHLEPAVSDFKGPLVGAVYSPGDEVGDPRAFCNSVRNFLDGKERISFRFNTNVEDVVIRDESISHLLVNGSIVEADAYIFCAGHLTSRLARHWGERLPILPMAGYSVTIPANNNSPHTSLTDLESKTVVSRLGDKCRCAGFADLGSSDVTPNDKRAKKFKQMLEERFGSMITGHKDVETWIGHRPMTPNSLPIIRKAKLRNSYLNCGHGMLGWTMAAGSAEVITRTIEADLLSRQH